MIDTCFRPCPGRGTAPTLVSVGTFHAQDEPPASGLAEAAVVVTHAVGDQAILLLDRAHEQLQAAHVVASPAPSIRWFELMAELAHIGAGNEDSMSGSTKSTAHEREQDVLNTA